ncbi:MAG: TRAP transporter small permease subunit [candidate division Zixibacteria bacterium]|nr:TRAP transporter small permease subunit [candidate division Zixibacteria bacterium]
MRITRGRFPIIKRIASLFHSIGFVLGITLMILMILTLSAGVCTRYVFNRPIFWTDEFARIVLIWSIFIGAALGFRKGSPIDHIRMDFFVSLLPLRLREIADKVAWGVTVFFCLTIVVLGVRFFIQTISFRTAALEISRGYIYISLPIFAIISLGFLFDLWTHR